MASIHEYSRSGMTTSLKFYRIDSRNARIQRHGLDIGRARVGEFVAHLRQRQCGVARVDLDAELGEVFSRVHGRLVAEEMVRAQVDQDLLDAVVRRVEEQ